MKSAIRNRTTSVTSFFLSALTILNGVLFVPVYNPKMSHSLQESLELCNEYICLSLFGDAKFTLSDVDGKDLLYPRDTSYGSLRAGDSVYAFPDDNLEPIGELQMTGSSTAQERFRSTEGVDFLLIYELVGEAVQFIVRAENTSSQSRHARARYLLDTQVDSNDGSPLWWGGEIFTREAVVSPPYEVFKGYDQIPDPTFTSSGLFITPPESVKFVHWPSAVEHSWNYSFDPMKQFYTPGFLTSPQSDSAVLIYYDLGEIPAGGTSEATFYYGLAVPEIERDEDELIFELERTKSAALTRINTDFDRLVDIHTAVYRVIFTEHGPNSTAIQNIINAKGWFDGTNQYIWSGDPSAYMTAGAQTTQTILSIILDGIEARTAEQLGQAMPHIYQDIGVPPDDPSLRNEIDQVLLADLEIEARKHEIAEAFDQLIREFGTNGIPEDYPVEAVVDSLRIYRSQLSQTTQQEGLLIWPNPELGTVDFQLTGVLEKHAEFVEKFQSIDDLGGGFQSVGFWIGVGAVVTKTGVAIFTGGTSLLLELGVATASAIGFSTAAAGKQIEIATDQAHAFVAVHGTLAAAHELDLVTATAMDMVQAIKEAEANRSLWVADGDIVDISLSDIVVEEGEIVAIGEGQITIRSNADETVPVTIFAQILGSSGGKLYPVGLLALTETMEIGPGETAVVGFEYGGPDSKILRRIGTYQVDAWVNFGYNSIHLTDQPKFAPELQIVVASETAVDSLKDRKTTLVDSGVLSENERSRSEVAISPVTGRTTLTLSYPGSNFDLHLYDTEGQHVGINYDTGVFETDIEGVSHSGSNVRPEMITIDGHAGEQFQVEIIAVQSDVPEEFTVVSSQYAAPPALLGVDPLEITIPLDRLNEPLTIDFSIYEYGGENGVSSVTAEVSSFLPEGGTGASQIQPSFFRVTLPSEVKAGSSEIGSLTIDLAGNIRRGAHHGFLYLEGVDDGTGEPIRASASVTLLIGESELSADPGLSVDGGGFGIGVVLGIVALAAAGLFVYSKSIRRGRGRRSTVTFSPAYLLGDSVGRVLVGKDKFVMGRESSCDLVIHDRSISRTHTMLRFAEGSWFIQDLESASGTWVNNRKVSAKRLHDGDQIGLGNSRFLFTLSLK